MDNDIKLLEIGLQVNCNFRCSYCIAEYQDNWTKLTSLSVDEISKFISTYTDDSVLISVTGGEPLLWDGLEQLISRFPDNLFMISSNISMLHNHEWLVNPTPELVGRVCFRVGWHPNMRTDDFLLAIGIIKDAGYHYVVNYMIDDDDIGNEQSRISWLKSNDIIYEVSVKEDSCGYAEYNEYTSPQFTLPNYIDDKYFTRINSNGNVYGCYDGPVIGSVSDNTYTYNNDSNKIHCRGCVGLKGYTKILSQWDVYDFTKLFPVEGSYEFDVVYDNFLRKVEYIDIIDDDNAIDLIRRNIRIGSEK